MEIRLIGFRVFLNFYSEKRLIGFRGLGIQ